jgi:two-component system response regulator QseB
MRANRVITRRVLEEHILLAAWPMPAIPWTYMGNLRRKIGEGYIRTVRGVGYVIDQQGEASAQPGPGA